MACGGGRASEHARVPCGRNHKITQSAKQRRSHLHKISVLILCNLVVFVDIHTLSKYALLAFRDWLALKR